MDEFYKKIKKIEVKKKYVYVHFNKGAVVKLNKDLTGITMTISTYAEGMVNYG